MPRNVFGNAPVADKAKPGLEKTLGEGNFDHVRGLTKTDKRVLNMGLPDIFIYNVSPIWQWNRPVTGRGTVLIPKCKEGQRVSDPLVIPGAIIRDYDAGSGKRQAYTEEGKDIAEDILGCSKEILGMPQNDLTNFGCFFLEGTKLEDLPKEEQEELIRTAQNKHDVKCDEAIMFADQLWANPNTKSWITPMYRFCAAYRDPKNTAQREWVAKSGRSSSVTECPFCGYEVRKGLPKCPNCREILDQALYDSLRGTKPAKGEGRAKSTPD